MPSLGNQVESQILAELRRNTRTLHRSLEARPRLATGFATPANYRLCLERFYGIYAVLEPAVMQVADLPFWLTDIRERQRLPALTSDLGVLNSSMELPLCRDLPPLGNVAEAFGCLYVLEGSTLGGQFIAREVHSNLGFSPENGCRFFSSFGGDVKAKWRHFTASLESFTNSQPRYCSAIVATAIRTFQSFDQWFAEEDNLDAVH